MTGIVLVAKEPLCPEMAEKFSAVGADNERYFLCSSGEAGAFALLLAAGVSPEKAARAMMLAAECFEIGEADALLARYIKEADGEGFGFCVPVIDLSSLEQFSYTNIDGLVSGKIEAGLIRDIPASTVAASAVFGLCPGFSYMDRTFSAGRENMNYCLNCIKRLGYETLILEG